MTASTAYMLEKKEGIHPKTNIGGQNMDKKAFLVAKVWVYFGYNYFDPKEFIKYICEKCDKMWLYKHTMSKFEHIYDVYGAHAVMNNFYVELDADLRDALVEYAIKFYAPTAFNWTDEERELLGI